MIGATTSQTLDLTLINKGDTIYGTSTIKLEIGLKIGPTIEYIPIGIYNIDDVEKNDYTVKITAFDNMIKFEKNFTTNLGNNLTLQQVVNELTRITGVQFTGSLPSYTVKKLEGFTCREVLGYVASICGGNAVITRDGKFTIVTPKEVSYSIGTENYFDYKREETKYKIGKISCQVGEEVLSKGSLGTDSMELEFENPWINATILTDIYNKLNGFEYLGYSMKWQGDLSLDVGDIITITDKKGVVRKHPILSQKFTYTGGLTSEIGAKGETKNKNSFSSSGSTANKVNRVVAELLIVNEALINKANIQDLEAVSIRTETLEAKTATIEEAIINVAHIEDLNAINATIENLKTVDLAAITAKITNLQSDKANITDLTATNIKFNVASGGTLDLQTLLAKHITGENGQFLNITSSNTVIANAVIKDAMIENISLNKLLAGTISTNKFIISSDDGGITIVGPTMQFKDKSNKVRIQMGQDTQGSFNFILRGEDGTTTLIDHTGIKEKAIADDLIKSNMVAADAIGEKQINYSSFVTGLNKDTNTSLIKASKVAIDLTGQSLEVSFNSLKSNVDGIQVGGRNLLTGTSKEFKSVTFSGWDYYFPYINNIKEGDVFSAKIYLKPTVHDTKVMIEFRDESGSVYSQYISEEKINVGNEGYVSISATCPKGKTKVRMSIRHLLKHTTNNTVQYKEAKFERGNKPTDWTPAPEDVEQKIESNTTAITVAQGKIEGLISENTIIKGDITTISDKYTSLKATVDGINTTVASHTSSITTIKNNVDNMSIGIKNLVPNSKINLTSNNYGFGGRVVIGGLKNNTTYTFTVNGRTNPNGNTDGKVLNCYVYESSWKYGSWNFKISETSDTTRSLTFTTGNEIEGKTVRVEFYYFPNNGDRTGNATVNWCTLVEGNKAMTDWTPAPEDIDLAINGVVNDVANLTGKVTTVENNYSTLSQDLSGFKTTVGNTYSTKSELSTVDGKVASLSTRVGTAESSITQLNNKIALKVEATDVTNAINNIQVGGRNLYIIKNSNEGYLMNSTFDLGSMNVTRKEHTSEFINVKEGETYIFQNWVTVTVSSSEYLWMSYQLYDSNKKLVGTRPSQINSTELANGLRYNYYKINIPSGASYLRVSARFYNDGKIKLEKGNKSTDWTPAPEDVATDATTKANNAQTNATNASKNYTDGQITTVNKTITDKVAEIKLTTDSITQKVSNTESSLTTKINTAQSTADTAQNTANTNKTEISSAKSKLATIETNLNSITSRVSSTESNITTINGNISSLQSRMSSAELKITDSAIVSTVISSSTYINNLNGKVSTNQIISSINQTAETIKIQASKIQLEGTTTIAGSSGDKIRINNADYEILNGSTSKAFFGLRQIDDNRLVPRLALSHSGLNSTNNNYFVMTAHDRTNNPLGTSSSYVDLAYRCQEFKLSTGIGDVSNIRMISNGDIQIAALREVVIRSNYKNGTYINTGTEYDIGKFSSSGSAYFDGNLQIDCVRNIVDRENGLVLADYGKGSDKATVIRIATDSTGTKFVRPVDTKKDIRLGSPSNAWYNIYTSVGTYSSLGIVSDDIETLSTRSMPKRNDDILDGINFMKNARALGEDSSLQMDVTSILNTCYVEKDIEEGETYINLHEIVKLLIYEVKKLKFQKESLEERVLDLESA